MDGYTNPFVSGLGALQSGWQVLTVGGQLLAPHSGPEGTVLIATADFHSRLAWTAFSAPVEAEASARAAPETPRGEVADDAASAGELEGTVEDQAAEEECGAAAVCSQVRPQLNGASRLLLGMCALGGAVPCVYTYAHAL